MFRRCGYDVVEIGAMDADALPLFSSLGTATPHTHPSSSFPCMRKAQLYNTTHPETCGTGRLQLKINVRVIKVEGEMGEGVGMEAFEGTMRWEVCYRLRLLGARESTGEVCWACLYF